MGSRAELRMKAGVRHWPVSRPPLGAALGSLVPAPHRGKGSTWRSESVSADPPDMGSATDVPDGFSAGQVNWTKTLRSL